MILYIKRRSYYNIAAITHLQALKEIYGENEVYIVDLMPDEQKISNNYISYGKYQNILKRIQRWMEGNSSFISDDIIADILRIIKKKQISLIFSEESYLGNLMKRVKEIDKNINIIIFYHDIIADLYQQRKKQSAFWKLHYKYIECPITIKQEAICQKYSDYNWVFNQSDAMKYRKFYGKEPEAIIPLASYVPDIDEKIRHQITPASAKKKILFVCSGYYVNILGFAWFYKNVLYKLHNKFELNIVGTGTNLIKSKFPDLRINYIGGVDSLENYYLEADICIIPIFDGGGMKVKTSEAISYGKCIVSSFEGMHGYWEQFSDTEKNKIIFESDSAYEWIKIINDLLNQEIRKFNKDIFEVFKEKLSYEAMLNMFKIKLKNGNI